MAYVCGLRRDKSHKKSGGRTKDAITPCLSLTATWGLVNRSGLSRVLLGNWRHWLIAQTSNNWLRNSQQGRSYSSLIVIYFENGINYSLHNGYLRKHSYSMILAQGERGTFSYSAWNNHLSLIWTIRIEDKTIL